MNQLAQELITTISSASSGSSGSISDRTAERIVRRSMNGGAKKAWYEIHDSLNSLIRTTQIRVELDLSDALIKSLSVLDSHRKREMGFGDDLPIKMSNLPQHIQFLLNLASLPTKQTHEFAHSYLHRTNDTGPSPDEMLYQEIMSEPFDDPYGGVEEEEIPGWTDSESETEEEFEESGEEEIILTPQSTIQSGKLVCQERQEESEKRMREAKRRLEELKVSAYWERGGKEIKLLEDGIYGWRDLTTLSLTATVEDGITKAVTCRQFQRELLYGLSGRPGIFYTFSDDGHCNISDDHPQVTTFSSVGLRSILKSFQSRFTDLATIRAFVKTTPLPPSSSVSTSHKTHKHISANSTKTIQAFTDSCRRIVQGIDLWIAEQERLFILGCSTPLSTSPLQLKFQFESDFSGIVDYLLLFLPYIHSPILLLNTIHSVIETIRILPHPKGLSELSSTFVETAKPMWEMLGDWLRQGMPVSLSLLPSSEEDLSTDLETRELDPEFFIKRDRDVSWIDEDFWESGYIISEWPTWLSHENTQEMILEAGKARGLLKCLQTDVAEWNVWKPLSEVLGISEIGKSGMRSSVEEILEQELKTDCLIATFQLRRVLDEECGLKEHLEAIEGVVFMRAIGVMQEWSEWLFDQIHSKKKWSDSQTLTSTLRETLKHSSGGGNWLNPAAIRIHLSGRLEGVVAPSVLSGLRITYEVSSSLS
ncbi:hypothetical protein TREMEDRAFT_11782, partial [Tremella mesenterica DSM 1558]|uniref:uncharacterized protein n=1 Tax=Tremella mesenterica (strain ATCC 24925 / CBS 8224 / DSM 1558 / NBRC 9311 / NRRL Y-6157 / RJB 2259-6 / UBC 559-6) TaxID=578456 RepID=UPI0003F49D0E